MAPSKGEEGNCVQAQCKTIANEAKASVDEDRKVDTVSARIMENNPIVASTAMHGIHTSLS